MNKQQYYILLTFLAVGIIWLASTQASAQTPERAIVRVVSEKEGFALISNPKILSPAFTIPDEALIGAQAASSSLNSTTLQQDIAERVVLSDGKKPSKERHSIMPSAVTILGSPAIIRKNEKGIASLRQRAIEQSTSEYLSPIERERWAHDWEVLRHLWIKEEPSNIDDLPRFLTHQVPPATLVYLQREYANFVKVSQEEHQFLSAKIIYSFLRNEARPFSMAESRQINNKIERVRMKGRMLSRSINKDPYLLAQEKYWDYMFGAFNPLIKSFVIKPTLVFRTDTRKFVLSEFALHNPDGSSPYLPKSDSMIVGESMEDEDDFDEEQYSGQPEMLRRNIAKHVEERRHKQEMIQLAEQERDELLKNIPPNMRIAVINDDLLPLLNFEGWAKNGYLGKGATVATFRDGLSFLKEIRNGVRYDLVITDLVIPNGGVSMMEDFRLLDRKAIVFASSKFYPGDGDDHSAQDLFNFGMDGYIWNNTNLNEGSFGYIQYLRQLNNYFYYKNKYGWER